MFSFSCLLQWNFNADLSICLPPSVYIRKNSSVNSQASEINGKIVELSHCVRKLNWILMTHFSACKKELFVRANAKRHTNYE